MLNKTPKLWRAYFFLVDYNELTTNLSSAGNAMNKSAKKERNVGSAGTARSGEDGKSGKRRPRSVTCYICGR